ncbi:fasciclin domain-containing protein [Nocardioides aestuarii]|uniref:Fasciclin domain-containing protein n=1 Tax=Nocardioides aestuarii TaxID=252231 RepID=A0ABW4TJI0_9ACTN
MTRTTVLKKTGLAAAALAITTTGLAACGADESEPTSGSEETTSQDETPMEESPSEDAGEMDPAALLYGDACSEVPTSGDGSVEGMATAPVASAASANPLLSTLVTAVGAADLVEPLNSAEELTVFAPANPAFEAFSKKQLNGLLKDKETLTAVLTHHVVPERVDPADLGGEYETLNGDTLTINGTGEEATIGDEKATVLCGGVQTANATVYIIDTVMMP